MRYAVSGEGTTGDDQPVRADDPEQAHAKVVRTGTVVAVEEHDFRHRPAELNRLEPAPQPHQVSCMDRTGAPRMCLASLDRDEAGAHQAGEHPLARNEGVLGTHARVRAVGKHRRRPLAYRIQRQPVVERIGGEEKER